MGTRFDFFLGCLAGIFLLLVSCQQPVASGPTTQLSVSWTQPPSKALLPSVPALSTYDLTLTPDSGVASSKTGLTATSFVIESLLSTKYTVTVDGKDSAGKVVATGSGTVDLSQTAKQSLSVTLAYIDSGTTTGNLKLTLDSSTSGMTVSQYKLTLVDPAGNVTTPALSVSGTKATYSNPAALVGWYRLYANLTSGTKAATLMETVLVLQNVLTEATSYFVGADFVAAPQPVSSLSLNQSTSSLLVGQSETLTPVFNAGAGNLLVSWSSSDPTVLAVDQKGMVTALKTGSNVTIRATSAENSAVSSTCQYSTVKALVIYHPNATTYGTMPSDPNPYQSGTSVTVLGNTGNSGKPWYTWTAWNTKADGTGQDYSSGNTLSMPSTGLTLYAKLAAISGGATWATGTTNASVGQATFNSVVTDSSGNIYAAGSQTVAGVLDFGNSVTWNSVGPLVVKYSSSGLAQWVAGGTATSGSGSFVDAAFDGSGNLYVVGSETGTAQWSYGNNVSGPSSPSGTYAVIVKFSPAGLAQWVGNGPSVLTSTFSALAIDPSGNIFVVGYGTGMASAFSYTTIGPSATPLATSSATTMPGGGVSTCAMFLKLTTSGSFVSTSYSPPTGANTTFQDVALMTFGANPPVPWVLCQQSGAAAVNYSTKSATGTRSGNNSVLVQYDAAVSPQMTIVVNSDATGSYQSEFNHLTVDPSAMSNVNYMYVTGYQQGTATYPGPYCNGGIPSNPASPTSVTLPTTGSSPIIACITPGGTLAWVTAPTTSSTTTSKFTGVTQLANGTIAAVGFLTGTSLFTFGSVVAQGYGSSLNAISATFNRLNGNPLTASSSGAGTPATTQFNAVATGGAGTLLDNAIVAVGSLNGTTTATFGPEVAVTGTATSNPLVVKY